MVDIYDGTAGERKQSPPRDSIDDRGREWWDETPVGDHSVARDRRGFVCSECSESHPYPSEFESVECDTDD